jgi:two-component system cell cycle sensor histidine kinase/response regulator CckA
MIRAPVMPLSLLPLLIGPAILLPLAIYAFRQRHVRGANWYCVLLVAIALWSAAYALELRLADPAHKLLALKFKYLGVVALPLAWLTFVLDFVAYDPAIVRRVARGMAVVAVFTLLTAWTNDWHGLFWGQMRLDPVGTLHTLTGRGPGFWLNVAYTYAALLAGLAILVGQAVLSPYLYRKRTVILVLAAILPWIGNLIFVTRGEGPGTIDFTPFLFTCTALIAAVAVFRYRVLEPIPTLRDARIEVIGDGFLILDRSRRIADLNRAAESIIGRSRASAAGEPIEHVLPEWPADVETDVRQDLTLAGPGGGRIYDVRITPIRAPGEPRTGYVVLLRDVTDRRHTEVALRDSELRYRDLVENARDLICTCDLDGRILSVNRAGLALTGYTNDSLAGRQILDLVAPESRELAKAMFTGVHADLSSDRIEIAVLAKDGHRLVLELASWVQRRNGVPIAIQAIGRDVTERRRLEEELRQAQKMEAVGKLAGGVAHDFNNLLTAIIGFAAMAETDQPPGTPLHEWMVEIRRSGEQAATLTRQLLAFGRRQMLQPVDLDLNRVVDDLQKMLRRLIGEDIELIMQLTPAPRWVRADRSQVEQVLVNLAVNARDAMPRGGRLTIRTASMQVQSDVSPGPAAGDYAAIVVEDTGDGIDPSIVARIFEPFFTTKPFGRGTGLGLSTVYGIVKQSRGDVQVHSTPGRGATFTVLLPAVASPTVREKMPDDGRKAQPAAPATGGASVLIVEDDAGVRRFATQVLREAGWTVLVADDPADALAMAACESEFIDLLVTDVILPGINGRDLADRLRALRPGLRVLFISGYAPEEMVASGALPAGGQLLQKPFLPAALRDRVAHILKPGIER